MYYLIFNDKKIRDLFIKNMKEKNIYCTSHYVPLHSSDAGKKFGRVYGNLDLTNNLSSRIARLPLWVGLEKHIEYVISETIRTIKKIH